MVRLGRTAPVFRQSPGGYANTPERAGWLQNPLTCEVKGPCANLAHVFAISCTLARIGGSGLQRQNAYTGALEVDRYQSSVLEFLLQLQQSSYHGLPGGFRADIHSPELGN